MRKFFGNTAEGRLLRRSQFDDQRHEQTLALDLLRLALAQDSLEQHALVGHMLIDDPEAIFVNRENERISNLAERTQRSKRFESRRGLRLLRDRRRAAVIGDWLLGGRPISDRLPSNRCLGRAFER